jgi:hypothetical protein
MAATDAHPIRIRQSRFSDARPGVRVAPGKNPRSFIGGLVPREGRETHRPSTAQARVGLQTGGSESNSAASVSLTSAPIRREPGHSGIIYPQHHCISKGLNYHPRK